MRLPVNCRTLKDVPGAGLDAHTQTYSDTFQAFISTASRSEYYQARSAGERVDLELEVNADSYHEEGYIEVTEPNHFGGTYRVVRVYATNPHIYILSLARR